MGSKHFVSKVRDNSDSSHSKFHVRRLGFERPELDALAGDASLPRGKVRERRHAVADVVIGFGQHGQIQVWARFRQLYKRDLQQRHARDTCSDQTFDTA